MIERELAFHAADELVTVATMAERKQAMIARAAGFLTLPGGIGTLEEIAEVLTLRYLAQITQPAVFYNQNGYFDDLLRFFDRMTREKFRAKGMAGLYSKWPRRSMRSGRTWKVRPPTKPTPCGSAPADRCTAKPALALLRAPMRRARSIPMRGGHARLGGTIHREALGLLLWRMRLNACPDI